MTKLNLILTAAVIITAIAAPAPAQKTVPLIPRELFFGKIPEGATRPANRIAFNAITESFFAKCLGGRAEPIGDALKASSAKVPHGADLVPGLGQD